MKTILLAFFSLLLIIGNTNAQIKTWDFELTSPTQKIQGSLYSTIELLDARPDNNDLGIIKGGTFQQDVKIVPVKSLSLQLQNFLDTATDLTAKKDRLLLHIRVLNFDAPGFTTTSGCGIFTFTANLYMRDNAGCHALAMIDTAISYISPDALDTILAIGNRTIGNFIVSNLASTAVDNRVYTMDDVTKIDSIDKSTIPLFTTGKYVSGVYKTYASFKAQVPDYTDVQVKRIDNDLTSVKLKDSTGEFKKIKSKDIYAVVSNGMPFIATEFGYYPLEKRGDDFYFTGKSRLPVGTIFYIEEAPLAAIVSGTPDASVQTLTKAPGTSLIFYMQIDYQNGQFIHLGVAPNDALDRTGYPE